MFKIAIIGQDTLDLAIAFLNIICYDINKNRIEHE